jgi:hypothetical protein
MPWIKPTNTTINKNKNPYNSKQNINKIKKYPNKEVEKLYKNSHYKNNTNNTLHPNNKKQSSITSPESKPVKKTNTRTPFPYLVV